LLGIDELKISNVTEIQTAITAELLSTFVEGKRKIKEKKKMAVVSVIRFDFPKNESVSN
jgi:hypothetical protein